MQLSTAVASLKLGAIAAAIGAVAAAGVSFTLPNRYVSSAVLRLHSEPRPGEAAWEARVIAFQRLQSLKQEVLSRSSLVEIIQRPAIDLYQDDRAVYPMEDVIQTMRMRDLRIQLVEPPAGGPSSAPTGSNATTIPEVRISFEYPDRSKRKPP